MSQLLCTHCAYTYDSTSLGEREHAEIENKRLELYLLALTMHLYLILEM